MMMGITGGLAEAAAPGIETAGLDQDLILSTSLMQLTRVGTESM